MNITFKIILLLSMSGPLFAQNSFKQQQLSFERVKTAYTDKWDGLKKDLKMKRIKDGFQMYIVAYKEEGKLEVWLKNKSQSAYSLFKSYDFSAHSGKLGPKIKEGDLQTPEGYYAINAFNPQSNFYLSLGVNYPNQADLFRSGKNKPGGDIYIHGNQVTVGCIPLTDDKIKEVYVLATESRNAGQKEIPVSIYPFRMTNENVKSKLPLYPQQKLFWTNLQEGYVYFVKHKKPPVVQITNGGYIFKT